MLDLVSSAKPQSFIVKIKRQNHFEENRNSSVREKAQQKLELFWYEINKLINPFALSRFLVSTWMSFEREKFLQNLSIFKVPCEFNLLTRYVEKLRVIKFCSL